MILIIDNYDSFTYNLYQLAAGIEPDVRVVRNDALTVSDIVVMQPSHIILSPGPGYPKDAGVCEEVVKMLGAKVPVLGVCLGHQAICEAYGATITYARTLMHGKKSRVTIDNTKKLFAGLPDVIEAARYHSLVADGGTLPQELDVIAKDEAGEVMAVAHREHAVYGLQFHPESVLTPMGEIIMRNFLGGQL